MSHSTNNITEEWTMESLKATLSEQFEKSEVLKKQILANFEKL